MTERPIGVFDSGVGGLTVLRALRRRLPQESLIYVADTARLPYGSRSPAEIEGFVAEILHWLAQQNVKMAIAACNTSSVLALDQLRDRHPFPCLGVTLPGARAAAQGQRIGVIATEMTVRSQAYRRAIAETAREANRTVQVWEVACPEFVPLIEANRLDDPYTHRVARRYLAPLLAAEIDTLVFGCTHYPYLEKVLRQILPPTVRFIDPAEHVATAAWQELEVLGLRQTGRGHVRFYASGDPERFAQRAGLWLGHVPLVTKVNLSPVELRFGKS